MLVNLRGGSAALLLMLFAATASGAPDAGAKPPAVAPRSASTESSPAVAPPGPTAAVVTTPTLAAASKGATTGAMPVVRSVVPGAPGASRPPLLPLGLVPQASGATNPVLSALAPSRAPALAWDGQVRYRLESLTPLDFRPPGTLGRPGGQTLDAHGDFSGVRTRVGASLAIARGVRGYASLQDARTMGHPGALQGAPADTRLRDAWLDLDSLGVRRLSLRLGRQPFTYGEGRILARSEWTNAAHGYDGARLRWSSDHVRVDGFVTRSPSDWRAGRAGMLSGADALWRGRNGEEAEAYQFRRDVAGAAWTGEDGSAGALRDATSGVRARSPRGPIEVQVESALQRGRRAGDVVQAGLSVVRVTAHLHSAWQTRLFAERALSTGDADPADGRSGRFEPVDWDGHDWQGTLDLVGESNSSDWCGGIAARPSAGWTVQSELHVLSLSQARDAWIDDSGTTLRRDATGAAGTDLGREFDVTVRWDPRARVSVLTGVSRFWRGEFVRRTGGGDIASWGFLQFLVGL